MQMQLWKYLKKCNLVVKLNHCSSEVGKTPGAPSHCMHLTFSYAQNITVGQLFFLYITKCIFPEDIGRRASSFGLQEVKGVFQNIQVHVLC